MLNITVLSLDGCSATPKTIKLIKKVADREKIAVDIDHQIIRTPDEARQKKFIGSPTVRINGIDIDPNAAEIKNFGLT